MCAVGSEPHTGDRASLPCLYDFLLSLLLAPSVLSLNPSHTTSFGHSLRPGANLNDSSTASIRDVLGLDNTGLVVITTVSAAERSKLLGVVSVSGMCMRRLHSAAARTWGTPAAALLRPMRLKRSIDRQTVPSN